MTELILQPTEEIKYPTWQPACRAVMIEIDPVKVKEKLAVAEAAMARRSRQLTAPEGDPERRAMKEEGSAMKLALAEVLSQHPDLKK